MRGVMIALGLAGIGYTLILLCLQSFHLGMLPSSLFGGSLLAALFVPPGWGRTLLAVHSTFWLLFFTASLLASRIGASRKAPPKGTVPEILIVLGYQLQRGRTTATLNARVDTARGLAERFPDALLILSGGQPVSGPSEAGVMADRLETEGISRNRMILEESSGSSYQNMEACRRLWEERSRPRVWAVTSSFHALRAFGSAASAGLPLFVVSAPSPAFTYPAEIFREGILWVKTALFGYSSMSWANGKL